MRKFSENKKFRERFKSHSIFSVLGSVDEMFYDFSLYERRLEWNILVYFINPVLKELFNEQSVEVLWPEIKDIHVNSSVVTFENKYPLEFIICSRNERIGVRYTDLFKEEVKKILRKYKLSRIICIDWSDKQLSRLEKINNYETITPDIFFSRYFSDEIYGFFLQNAKQVIDEANRIVGIKTIPQLSLRYLNNFKIQILDSLRDYNYSSMRYKLLKNSVDSLKLIDITFDNDDYQTLRTNFIERGLYKSLVGSENFAKSFYTSEYLFIIIKEGQNLDYTSVVSGYLKSIEQLIYKLLMINLEHPNGENLWIKKNRKYLDEIEHYIRDNPQKKKSKQIAFVKDLKDYYDTTLISMIWFLNDNQKGWNVSQRGKRNINKLLKNYAKDCRNDNFHKDNIIEYENVVKIRENTIMLLFLILGGYKLSGNTRDDLDLLGVIDNSFDNLFRKLSELPKSASKFIIVFPNEKPIYAIRNYHDDVVCYDDDASISNKGIKFTKVDSFESSIEDVSDTVSSDKVIFITKNNLPAQIGYFIRNGETVYINFNEH